MGFYLTLLLLQFLLYSTLLYFYLSFYSTLAHSSAQLFGLQLFHSFCLIQKNLSKARRDSYGCDICHSGARICETTSCEDSSARPKSTIAGLLKKHTRRVYKEPANGKLNNLWTMSAIDGISNNKGRSWYTVHGSLKDTFPPLKCHVY